MDTVVFNQVVEECKSRDFRPTRIVQTDDGGYIMSWLKPGKYAEIEFVGGGTVEAAVSFETGSPSFINLTGADAHRVTAAIIRLQDFME